MDYKDKVILITGGAGGIGKAIGSLFLEKEAKVCLCDINDVDGIKFVKSLSNRFGHQRVLFVKCDVTKDEDFQAAYDECENHLGTIDILINNAGIFSKDLKKIMAINFESVVRGTELALKRMGKHHGGKGGFVINVASELGTTRFPYMPYYATSKAAVVHYSRCVGHEFHFDYSGVHILCLCPTCVDTPLSTMDSFMKGSYNSHTDKAMKEIIPIIKKLKPDEVAEATIQLINDKKLGTAMVIQKGLAPFYVTESLLMNY